MVVSSVVGKFAVSLLPIRSVTSVQNRRTRLYCVGTPKSGTHSIADMFSEGVRAAHEPRAAGVIEKILDAAAGRINRRRFTRWIRERDRELDLEVDSSHLNLFLLDILPVEFPEARFVMPIRDCYSWLDSFMNHALHFTQAGPEWLAIRDFLFGRQRFVHAPEEKLLKDKGLHTLDGYLSAWATHNKKVLSLVPAERLLIVRTDQIRERAFEIADFAGLPRESIKLERTHSFKNPEKFNLLRQLDLGFLEEKVEKHCGLLMRRFFPEIKSLADAKL